MTQVPYQVHIVNKLVVESEGLAFKCTVVISTQEANIINSYVPLAILQELCDRTEYAEYWKNPVTAFVVDLNLCCLQVVIGITLAVMFRQLIS